MTNVFEQVPFGGAATFADNPEPRCPCVLLLDTSGSMQGAPIEELNQGLIQFKEELLTDGLAAKRVEVAIVGFGPVRVVTPFTSPEQFTPPELTANGDTPMGAAIERAFELIRLRKEEYRANGIAYFRPWIFLITDGSPTDSVTTATRLIKDGETNKTVKVFAVGVQGADLDNLSQLVVNTPLRLNGLRFRDLFAWLSNSLSQVSHSTPGDEVPLENPVTPKGWASV